MKSLGTYALYATGALLVAAGALLGVISANAQNTIVIVTPTAAATATPEPIVDMSPIGLLNPQPGELPVITDALNIDPTRTRGYIITDASPIFVREGDDALFRPVAVAEGGVLLAATGVNEAQTWWRVRTANDAYEGWINAELLILRGDLTDVPVIDRSEMGTRLTPTFITFAPQPVYRTPGDNNEDDLICTIRPDENAAVGRSREGDFFQIIATCQDGRQVVGFIDAEVGGLRNVTDAGLPIAETLMPMLNGFTAQPVIGPSLLTFQEQTVYLQPEAIPFNAVCRIPTNRYPIIARKNTPEFYLISATCVGGDRVDAWIPVAAGAFQNDSDQSVPLAITPQATPIVTVPERAARFLTFLPQPLGAMPDGRTLCEVPPGEYQILARTPRATHYLVVAACEDTTVQRGWLPIDTGAFRNPFDETVPIREP
jgi:hypothetical protein